MCAAEAATAVLIKGFTSSLYIKKKGKKKKEESEEERRRQETSVCYLQWGRDEGRMFVPLRVNE